MMCFVIMVFSSFASETSAAALGMLICLSKTYEAAFCNCLYLTQFLTDFGQIFDYKSYDC